MLVVITGGSGSGKSAYAEEVLLALAGNRKEEINCYYLATMMVFGEEGRQKVAHHKKLREGKGFLTIEQPVDIGECQVKTDRSVALLECMSNLAANEMFREKQPKSIEEVTTKITTEIMELSRRLEHLVIVTNNVFEDGICYDRETMNYIKALGRMNRNLASAADVVTEVVAGIPVAVKGEQIL
ncbi:MAG: bifunctional adenosylcobinamide kinase/adenosylcobinamide-phosphate guanylyltransferase [Clostridiales bacterium]|nr:bifunctional adenosylcobinamide kinase/adenosylcobinamide-phosphate guanylyltransferase [Clostridiales bacterium]